MEEAARMLSEIAQRPSTTSMIIPIPRLVELGEQLVAGLREKLSIPDDFDEKQNKVVHSEPGEYPRLESGDLRDAVAWRILYNGIEFGYKQHGSNDDHQDSNYGELLYYEKSRKGPANFVEENEASSILSSVFGVNGYTVQEHPYQMIEV